MEQGRIWDKDRHGTKSIKIDDANKWDEVRKIFNRSEGMSQCAEMGIQWKESRMAGTMQSHLQ